MIIMMFILVRGREYKKTNQINKEEQMANKVCRKPEGVKVANQVWAEKVLTLSVYEQGMHRTTGRVTKNNIKWDQLSFAESLVPLSNMINEFHKFPLGTKILVTMKAVSPKTKK